MQRGVELVHPQARGVADGDVGLGDADDVHQLVEQGVHELRRWPDRSQPCDAPQVVRSSCSWRWSQLRRLEVVRLILMKIFSPGLVAVPPLKYRKMASQAAAGRRRARIAGQRPCHHVGRFVLVDVVNQIWLASAAVPFQLSVTAGSWTQATRPGIRPFATPMGC